MLYENKGEGSAFYNPSMKFRYRRTPHRRNRRRRPSLSGRPGHRHALPHTRNRGPRDAVTHRRTLGITGFRRRGHPPRRELRQRHAWLGRRRGRRHHRHRRRRPNMDAPILRLRTHPELRVLRRPVQRLGSRTTRPHPQHDRRWRYLDCAGQGRRARTEPHPRPLRQPPRGPHNHRERQFRAQTRPTAAIPGIANSSRTPCPRSDAFFLDERRGWVSFRSGAVFSTANGGESWQLLKGVNGVEIGDQQRLLPRRPQRLDSGLARQGQGRERRSRVRQVPHRRHGRPNHRRRPDLDPPRLRHRDASSGTSSSSTRPKAGP